MGLAASLLLATGIWLASSSRAAQPAQAPEAARVLAVQQGMPFQILIPAYMPGEFDRAAVDIQVNQAGPGGEPMAQLSYRTRWGASLFAREWVPVNPAMEVLANSRPIETKWGKGWLLAQREGLIALWVDVGPLRVSVYTPNSDVLTPEQLLEMANTLGPASNQQVFSFVLEQPQIQAVAPPPPVEIATNAQGVQEVDLIVTPGGYSPLRFAVRKDVPVRLTFRMLGQVGCGDTLIFPADPKNPTSLQLASEQDKQVFEFTPRQAGAFEFYCSHQMYRGIMTVHD